jgi:hypothetical protein
MPVGPKGPSGARQSRRADVGLPQRQGRPLSITLHCDLAGILGLAAKAKGPLDASDPVVECTNWLRGRVTTDSFSCRRYQSEYHVEKSSLGGGIVAAEGTPVSVFV